MSRWVIVLALVAASCGSESPASDALPIATVPSQDTTTSTNPDTTCAIVQEDACELDLEVLETTGTIEVTLGDTTYAFTATRCIIGIDAFVVDGVNGDGPSTVAIRHASPPTRSQPQPSMSYLLIEPEPDYVSPPASVQFEVYDPQAGIATGLIDDETRFDVRCEAGV